MTGPVVYYIQRFGLVKIGYTSSFEGRMRSLGPDKVLAVEPGDMRLEARRHREFAQYAMPGEREWYEPAPQLLDHIARLTGIYGVPAGRKSSRQPGDYPRPWRRVADDLRRKIQDGRWRPGDLLPTQQEMLAEYGVGGRGTIQNAINQLRDEGLVVTRAGSGTRVADLPAQPYLREGEQ